MDGFFQSHQTVPKPAILPSSIFPERSIALETTGSPKGAEIDPNLPHAKKVLLKVAHAFLYTWTSFQSHQIQPATFFHIPERSIAKRLAFTKRS
jgi:hypothetical protein